MIVEDERLVALDLRDRLLELGYDVVGTCGSGAEALECLREAAPDVVLMDIRLKGELDGIDTAARLARAQRTAVVYLTGHAGDATIARARATRPAGFLIKPCSERDLQAAVQLALQRLADERELRHRAHHDPLTGLANRALALERLDRALDGARRRGGRVALLMVDLDRFKQVNDGYGHTAGDEVLATLAARLVGCTRAQDTVARLGGDEFMIVVENVDRASDVGALARKIVTGASEPVSVAGVEIGVGASVGIGVFPDDAHDRDGLVRAADTALYATKERGRDGFAFHSSGMRDRLGRRRSLEREVRRCLAGGELELRFEPRIRPPTGEIVAAQALAHRRTGDGRTLGIETLLRGVESTGLLADIGDWTVREACRRAASWTAAGGARTRIAVDVPTALLEGDRLTRTFEALGATLPSRELIELGVTEDALRADGRALPAIRELAGTGIGFAVAGVGVGRFDPGALRRLAPRRLRLDASLVRDAPDDADAAAVLDAVIAMGHRLGLELIGEGVERECEHELLVRHGCDEARGRYYAEAVPGDAFARLLRSPGPALRLAASA